MSGHTPGPWRVAQIGSKGKRGLETQVRFGNDSTICTVTNSYSGQANADLIASCPTMYAFIVEQADLGNAKAQVILDTIHA